MIKTCFVKNISKQVYNTQLDPKTCDLPIFYIVCTMSEGLYQLLVQLICTLLVSTLEYTMLHLLWF